MSSLNVPFRYEAARPDGVLVRGLIDASSGPEAAAVLSARGLYPLAVEPQVKRSTDWFRRPPLHEQATVFQGLAMLVEAGIPLHTALTATHAAAPARLRDALARVSERVRQGESLAGALAREEFLSPAVTGLVRAGEGGVGLGAGLMQASRQLEREADSASRIRAALAYPAVLAIAGSASVALIVLYVIPRFGTLLGDVGQSLPPATRLLLNFTAALREYGLFAMAIIVVGALIVSRRIRSQRAEWHEFLLRLPLIGGLRQSLTTARVGRTLGALLATGAPALQALRVSAEAAGDAAVARRLHRAADAVAGGASLSAALASAGAISAAALQLANIGEGSGQLPMLLEQAAEQEQVRAERQVKALLALIEPALIVTFAALVAFVAAALLQAVYAVRPG